MLEARRSPREVQSADLCNSTPFLLHFKITDEIKESLMRTFPKKAGPENDVFLPLFLERVSEATEQYRITFRLFPRDLIECLSAHIQRRLTFPVSDCGGR